MTGQYRRKHKRVMTRPTFARQLGLRDVYGTPEARRVICLGDIYQKVRETKSKVAPTVDDVVLAIRGREVEGDVAILQDLGLNLGRDFLGKADGVADAYSERVAEVMLDDRVVDAIMTYIPTVSSRQALRVAKDTQKRRVA